MGYLRDSGFVDEDGVGKQTMASNASSAMGSPMTGRERCAQLWMMHRRKQPLCLRSFGCAPAAWACGKAAQRDDSPWARRPGRAPCREDADVWFSASLAAVAWPPGPLNSAAVHARPAAILALLRPASLAPGGGLARSGFAEQIQSSIAAPTCSGDPEGTVWGFSFEADFLALVRSRGR